MLFTKSLRRELRSIAGIVFATVFTIMVTTSLVRFLGRAAGGRVDSASVLPLIAFSSINILGQLLVLTLFVAVLMTLTRAWRDSEMVIWQASGQSLTAWIRPVFGFAMGFILLCGLISFYLSPWANQQIIEYQRRFEQREDVSMIAPGQFRESASANRVFFVESLNADESEVRNVFVTQQSGDRLIIVVSSSGAIESRPNGERYLVLEQGRRYDGNLDTAELRVMGFERYGLRIDPKPVVVSEATVKSKTTLALLSDWTPADQGEFGKRLGVPLSAALLALLAIPLSSSNPRVGRSINLLVALLMFMVYSNLLSITNTWIAQERLSFGMGIWIVHALAGGVVTFMFWRRLTLGPLLPRWRTRAPVAPAH